MRTGDRQLSVGVIGVGAMGEHHARVYDSVPGATLVGVHDIDDTRAQTIATEFDVPTTSIETLLEQADGVSITVPTQHHFDIAMECLEAGVATLIEKPVVADLDDGRKLQEQATHVDVPVQVGHVERFNPAVTTLESIIDELTIHSIAANRLGPPPEREISDSAALDLMIHDIDIVLSILGERPTAVHSVGSADSRHTIGLLEFESDVSASLTASRVTQRKVRTLQVTAANYLIELDYIDQSLELHSSSVPEYVEKAGNLRHKHEGCIERLHVSNHEPLQAELESFCEAIRTGSRPKVTLEDGLAALEIAQQIDHKSTEQGRTHEHDTEWD